MKQDSQKRSRSKILAGLLIVIAVVFIGRLFQLQVLQHDKYKALAGAEQISQTKLPAERGLIYAMDGSTPVQMVLNQTVYLMWADPTEVKDVPKVIDTVRKIAGGNAKSDLETPLNNKDSRYQVIATGVTRDQADKIKDADLSGIGFTAVNKRVYPEGGLAGQILGFVDADGDGQYGIEGGMDKELTGTPGLLKNVTDVAKVPLTIGNENIDKPAVNGENVVLSVDRNVQSEVEQALADGLKKSGATNGSVIVMDPQTGKVMAMANLPTYDPENYNTVTDPAVFNNGVISNPYEPGSDIKTFTMATGVDKGVVKASDTYNNKGSINVDGITVNNATGDGFFGNITFQVALNNSLNTGFVTVAERLGDGSNITLQARQTMYDYFYNKFRLGQLTGIQLAGEQGGTVISPEEQEGNAVRYSNMSFGQGMDITMLQVASGFSSIINGGHYYKPTIVAGTMSPDGKTYTPATIAAPTQTITQSTSDQLREMTQIARHTQFPNIDKPGYEVGGKTGTSQVAVNGIYSATDTVASYLGYGGGTTSNYVIMVEVSGKGHIYTGAKDAMPIFTNISNWLLDYLKVQPKG